MATKKQAKPEAAPKANLILKNATPLTAQIVEMSRTRTDLLRVETNLTRLGKSICRRLYDGLLEPANKLFKRVETGEAEALALVSGTALPVLLVQRSNLREERAAVEKKLLALSKDLPVAAWTEQVKGLSLLGLALMVGEAGNIGAYRNPSCLWKRMGLAVIRGDRQGRRKDADEALEHGYCPRRRSVVWNAGESLLRAGKDGPYYLVYAERKALEEKKAAEAGLTVAASADIPQKDAAKYISKGHIHNRAKRFMEKRLLRNLWVAWKEAIGEETAAEAA